MSNEPTKTPVDLGAEALYVKQSPDDAAFWHNGLPEHFKNRYRNEARAVFESIPDEWWDEVICKNWIATPGEVREAIKTALLTGGES